MNSFSVLLTVLFCFIQTAASAQTPEERGLAIAREADRRASGFGDLQAKMEMILRSKEGSESHRMMRQDPGDNR